MNLEVVRGRAERGGADVSSLARFAAAAAEELQRATVLVEALLALARPARMPIDLWMVLQPLVALHAAIAASEGGEVLLERPAELVVETGADATAVRLAVASALERVARSSAAIRCTVEARDGGLAVSVLGAPAEPLADEVHAALDRAGIGVERQPNGLKLLFAPAGREGPTTV